MDGQVRTAFPAELLSDRERSLEELGLVPSATLLVRVTGGTGGIGYFVAKLLAKQLMTKQLKKERKLGAANLPGGQR